MRGAASLGYLLARTSDTVADTASVPAAMRIRLLDAFAAAVEGRGALPEWPAELKTGAEPREAVLLDRSAALLAWLERIPPAEARLVREVVAVIVSGQKLDLVRFATAGPGNPVALRSDEELEDYAWRVAGCVGAFWTKLGCLTLDSRFSRAPEPWLLERGIAYGKGLQLVNILRDLPRDLSEGRCYLPVNPADREALLTSHALWVERAEAWVAQGIDYAKTLPLRRLRAATVLPAWLAEETLAKLHGADWEALQSRVKVPRRRVYRLLWDAWWW